MSEKITECPFCGGEDLRSDDNGVLCRTCGAWIWS
jgi:hypothetical protein